MQGIELSRRFYADLVRPWLAGAAPGLRHAAALTGYGSELLGFDDAMSRDHNWGPRVHLVVSEADFKTHARRLIEDFGRNLPETFAGEPMGWRARPHPPADDPGALGASQHGLEIHTLASKLKGALAIATPQGLTAIDWLGLPEQRLLAFTAGAVFHDDDGHLSAARAELAYFPDHVWLYKIACQWRRIAEQQAFVGRTGIVGDDLGSRVIAARLAHDVMHMAFLLARRYAPYAKWLGSAFKSLPLAQDLAPHLDAALAAPGWQQRGEALAAAYLVLAQDQLQQRIGDPFEPVIGPYHDRPFATINTDDIVAATMSAIADNEMKNWPVIGSIDQVSDLTPLLEDPAACHDVTAAILS
ncbi:MAG: DUF4037 domain-containing protein [Devosia sp.]|uniref:DUF4037 domain-containing protein n=1 Tax=Devosia sp. TaxID=1871048 RepID=UPI0024CA6E21|nr:DUF4037 domain-containing protein [Devosia sp.]UYO00953.1 MAG: DUF4037 domain-containing protein [Devosia sp.]